MLGKDELIHALSLSLPHIDHGMLSVYMDQLWPIYDIDETGIITMEGSK